MARDRVKVTSILGIEVEVNKDSLQNYLDAGFRVPDPAPRPAAKKAPAKPAAKKED